MVYEHEFTLPLGESSLSEARAKPVGSGADVDDAKRPSPAVKTSDPPGGRVMVCVPAILALLLLAAGCHQQQAVTVLVSGDTAGWITPCGCTSNQSGGLARRATLIGTAREAGPVMAVDVGGAVVGNSPYDYVKLRAILAGQMKMDLDAFNIGGPETQFTAAQLRELSDDLNVPFLSANLRDGDDKPIAPAVRIFAAAASRSRSPESLIRALSAATCGPSIRIEASTTRFARCKLTASSSWLTWRNRN